MRTLLFAGSSRSADYNDTVAVSEKLKKRKFQAKSASLANCEYTAESSSPCSPSAAVPYIRVRRNNVVYLIHGTSM